MARVRPFAGFRYATTSRDITPLTAPPYDVISPAQREQFLARDEHNVVALELPAGSLDPSEPGNRYETGAATWNAWREGGVLTADPAPAIYVLEQHFKHAGAPVRRRAFIAEVGLEPFSAEWCCRTSARCPRPRRPVRAHEGDRREPESGSRPL